MLIDTEIDISLRQNNIGYYRKMGYDDIMPKYKDNHYRWKVKVGTIIKVKVDDLPRYSELLIRFLCDYCGKEFNKTARNYFNTKVKDLPIKTDCCDECRQIKLHECNMLTKGCKTPFCDSNFQQENEERLLNKYGFINAFQVPEFQEKMRKTLMEKYGVPYIMQNKEILERARLTLLKNGNIPCSTQQKYLYKLFGGELNYLLKNINLDIAYPEEKLYIEYDGSGHNLNVKCNNITQDEFNKKERNRRYALYRSGWKEIRIVSKKDNFPSDKVLLQMIQYAREYLNTGHSYIRFDLDEGTVTSSQFIKPYDYGKLKRMRSDSKSQEAI